MDDPAHVRLVGAEQPRDLRGIHERGRGQQDVGSLALGLVLGSARDRLQPIALLGRQLADEDLRGTHGHLQLRVHARPFDVGTRFPVKRLREDH